MFGELKLSKGMMKTTILAELLEYAAGMSQQSCAEPWWKGVLVNLADNLPHLANLVNDLFWPT